MWPMSHALYPGLSTGNPRDRPTTADSYKTWYGNNRKSYASTSSLHSNLPSVHSHQDAPETELEAPGEDLGDLINRTQRVLSVLSTDADRYQARQSAELDGGPGSSDDSDNRSKKHDSESVVSREEFNASSRHTAVVTPSLRSRGLMSLASTEDTERDTPVRQSGQSLSRAGSTLGAGLPRVEVWKPESPRSPSSPSSESQTGQEIDQELHPSARDLASNKGSSSSATIEIPADDSDRTAAPSELASNKGSSSATIDTPTEHRTAAPSFTLAWDSELSEKKADSVQIQAVSSDSDNHNSHDDSKKEKEQEQEQAGEEEEDPTAGHLSGLPLASVTIALSAAVFLVAMDVNVIATAIPRITGEFRSLDDVGWYGSAFLMATCATQIPYGRIYSLFPAKWVFTSAIVVFMLGSLIAGVSPSSPVLILGRAVQGVGTSGILSGGFIIMSQVVPLRIRPTLTGGIGAMEGVAMISAPIIGGVLTDKLHWRWCFYINLPIGGFVLLVVLLCMRTTMPTGPRRSGKTTLRRTLYELDLLGAACLVPPIVCTLLALNFAGRQGHTWGDSDVILLLVLAVVLLCIFAYTQHIHADVAMLPFRVVKQRSVLAGFWFISCISSALVVITYFLPLWFQTVKDTSAQQSGIGILPMLVGVIIGVVASGALVSLIGYYTPFMLASSVLMPVGLGMLTTITPDTSRAALIAYPALFGLGVGMGFQQPLTGIQASLPQADIAPGTSIIVFGQTISAAIIIAVGESVFQNRLLVNLDSYLGINDVNTQELLGDSAGSLQSLVPVDKVPLLIEAVNASLTQTFYVAVAMAALSGIGSVFIGWNSVKQPKSRDEEGRAVVEPAQA